MISYGRDFYDDGYDDEEQILGNRIIFSPSKFFGRKEELQTLKRVYKENVCGTQECDNDHSNIATYSTPVIVVDGFSGTGKSALVHRFLNELKEEGMEENPTNCPFSMQGKFEELQNSYPYSAVIEALGGFFQSLLFESKQGNTDGLERIRKAIATSLGSEKTFLLSFIPSLREVLDTEEDAPSQGTEGNVVASSGPGASTGNSWNRLRYLFQKFFRAICTEQRPIVMFLDDLQWADDASLALMSSLIQDECLRYFLFVGAMRGNEVDKNNGALSKFLRDIDALPGNNLRIELLNLTIAELDEFFADTLNLDPDVTLPLTKIIYDKTRGNIFFSMQMLEDFRRRNIVYFSMINFQWEWNLKGVEFENAVSSDVSEAVVSKIQSLPKRLQRALVIASYTRSSLDLDTLKALLIADDINLDHKELTRLLDIAVLEGLLLNTVDSNVYKFAHDRIKQAAYWMVPSGRDRDELRIMIGTVLVELAAQPHGKDWMLFVAADHLNSCTGHGQADLFLAELNLACGEKANQLAAFIPASLYLRLALKYLRKLGGDIWQSNYHLSLRVYREIADIELCLGNFASGNDLCQQLIENASSFEDKLPTYLALVVAKGRQHRHAESLELCRETLFRLNAIPKRLRVIRMMRDFRIVQRLLRKNSDDKILDLPLCQDPMKAMIMDFLTEYALRSYHCGYLTEFLYAMVRKIRISFKYGLASGSAHAFASYGIFLQGPGNDPEGALRMACLAREMTNKMETLSCGQSTSALTLLLIASIIEPWNFPRERILKTLQRAHHIGMASGNIEIGFQSWASGNIFAQVCGYPLGAVEKTGAELMQQLCRYHVDSVTVQLEECQLSVSCLVGRRKVDWNVLEPTHVSDDKSQLYRNVFAYLSRLELAVFFGNYEFAVRMSVLIQPHAKYDGSYSTISREPFYSCLAYGGLARATGRRGYVSKAVKFARRLHHLCNTRGMNVRHKCLLLHAQIMSLRTENASKIITAFDEAIHAAMQSGYIQDAALSCEVAGEAMLDFGLETRGYRYLNQARDMWREYGAHAKVEHLLAKYGRKMDSIQGMTTCETVPDQFYSSVDLSETPRRSMDLALLSERRKWHAALKTSLRHRSHRVPERIAHLLHSQTTIGWDNFLLGRWSKHWITLQLQYLQRSHIEVKKKNHGLSWSSNIIRLMWDHCYKEWNTRNKARHGKDAEDKAQRRLEKAHRSIKDQHNLKPKCSLQAQ
ncbi:multi-sensor signal transduction multi-kinase [Nitzschia inconspicua]|uniref:Multi-sensor signal transduction multi-kinase n=1 Tax=Nitzschia inconspicua TaxID=303405 RepID=A0A9K3LUW1_9STRA|nr:multi-sensor signal transduction multi-kinase [Nitzschia inconspicua]